jgi:lauroyl/myristoyl acyltransferase
VAVYLAFRAATLLARIVPLRASYALARAAGFVAFYLWPGGRRRCIANMARVTGGDRGAAASHARRSFGNYLVYLVDFFRFMRLPKADLAGRVEFDGWDLIHAERRGNGIVVVTVHFGNWDLGASVLAIKGFPISAIADTFANPRIDGFVRRSREHLGMKVIPVERMGPGILRALRDNGVVALLIDVPTARGEGVEVEFFGETVSVPDGPARIALRAGSSVIAVTLPRVAPWDDRVSADVAQIPYEATGDHERDVRALTQAVFRELERLVRRDPAQWYIFRSLWVADMQPQPTA